MNKYVKYLKSLLYIFILVLIFNLIISILYHFNVLSDSTNNYLKLFTTALSMLIGGIYIGTKTSKKGWFEGLKIGLIVIILLFILSYLAFDSGFNLKKLIYYTIIMASTTIGSMIGINKRKN